MPADLANDAAVLAAGYTKVQTDYGALKNPRYETTYARHLTAQPGASGGPVRATGVSNTSAAAADTQAVAALNGFRKHRYGADTAVNSGSAGSAHTTDST